MICAYDEVYLERARSVMAHMLDYAVHGLNCDLNDFFQRFLVSDICPKFERGQASVIAGKSGTEIAYEVMHIEVGKDEEPGTFITMHRSPEYWLGWSLAYYQWYSGLRFCQIIESISMEDLREMYWKYHEMDIRHFAERMDEICREVRMETRLKAYRNLVGLSQRELAEKTEIPIRTIQQYEQRQKNINKAQAEYLIRLSKVLYCAPEDLLEGGE
jgi:DNA-binding transcriptional regulator YiaG